MPFAKASPRNTNYCETVCLMKYEINDFNYLHVIFLFSFSTLQQPVLKRTGNYIYNSHSQSWQARRIFV